MPTLPASSQHRLDAPSSDNRSGEADGTWVKAKRRNADEPDVSSVLRVQAIISQTGCAFAVDNYFRGPPPASVY